MGATAASSLLGAMLLLAAGACRSEEACLPLREQGFEVLNGAHPCADDSDCRVSEWPACGKALNREADAQLRDLQRRASEAGCQGDSPSCAERAVFCDRNFCVPRVLQQIP